MFIIITDYNGFSQTWRCLEALQRSSFSNFTVVVVDHGTSVETQIGLAAKFPEVTRLAGSPDLWWTGATNLGIRYALDNGAEMIMLLNNDCYVTPDTIGELVKLSVTNREAIFAPIQRDWQSGKITVITPRSLFLFGFPSIPGPRKLTLAMRNKQTLPAQIIAGGRGVLIPSSIFRNIGLFDEKHLPHYWADHDFYLRANQRGVSLYIATHAYVDIDNSRTTMADNPGRLSVYQWVNSLLSIRSHRNLIHVTVLFKRHYPVKHMYVFGVMFYTGRYLVMFLMRRCYFLLLQCVVKNKIQN